MYTFSNFFFFRKIHDTIFLFQFNFRLKLDFTLNSTHPRLYESFPLILDSQFRLFGILIIEDNEKAWFPAADLKEFHGIVPHEVTSAETLLFCIRSDGSEGLCCPTGGPSDDDEDLT